MDYPIEIDKNVPVPSKHSNGRHIKYPFSTMHVGDSFFVPDGKQTSLTATARNWAVRHGGQYRFVTRQVPGGVRVWRVG